MPEEISPEAVIAFAVLDAKQSGKALQIEDISKLFFEVRQKGLDEVEKVALQRVDGGFYSEDVEAFFGRLLATEYATARSPITVLDKGIRLCRSILESEMEAHPEPLKKVAAALGFEVPKLLALG